MWCCKIGILPPTKKVLAYDYHQYPGTALVYGGRRVPNISESHYLAAVLFPLPLPTGTRETCCEAAEWGAVI